MNNFDTFLQTLILATRFAETYSEGSYGSGDYNEAAGTTPAPTQTTTQTKTESPKMTASPNSETLAPPADDQPASTTDRRPTQIQTPTTQTTVQSNPAAESATPMGADLMWIIIGGAIAVIALSALTIVIAKKHFRS